MAADGRREDASDADDSPAVYMYVCTGTCVGCGSPVGSLVKYDNDD